MLTEAVGARINGGASKAGRLRNRNSRQAPSELEERDTLEQTRQRLLLAREAATYLGISLSTLNRVEKQALLVPFRTPGGHRRYARKMLDDYLEATRRVSEGARSRER